MLRHSLDAANRLTESREWLADPRDSIDTSRVTVMLDEVRGGFAVFNKPLAADTLSSGATVPALLMIMPIPPNSVADLCTACSTAISSAIESKTNIFRACSPGRPTGRAVPVHVGRHMISMSAVGHEELFPPLKLPAAANDEMEPDPPGRAEPTRRGR